MAGDNDFAGMGTATEEEFDFSGDGLPGGEKVFTITNLEVEVKEGKGVQHVVTFENADVGFPIPIGYWVEHTNPKAARAGRGQLKRIATAALGQPKYTASQIIGAKVIAQAKEDDQGFARISGFKPVPKAVEAVAL